ncbi:MAG: DUF2961 domain-containing protein [Bryobacterales bacterium]|nr:DUF2961 domain-containing protein [Bryobacterales bacterium]
MPVDVSVEIAHAKEAKQPDEGRLYALWNRQAKTADGQPFVFVDVQGHGQVVGVSLQSQGFQPGNTGFFEGDDQATIDGEHPRPLVQPSALPIERLPRLQEAPCPHGGIPYLPERCHALPQELEAHH